MFLKIWTWNTNTGLSNIVGQPFSNLKLNPNRILFWEKRDKNPVVICQYIKAIFFQSNKIIFNAVPFLCKQDGLKFTLNSHKRALRQSTSVPNSRSAENIWALINISIWHYHFFCVHYATVMVWQDCYWKISIWLFVHLFNSCGVLQCIRHCSQAGDKWWPAQNLYSKKRKQMFNKSRSKFPPNLQRVSHYK